MTRNRRFAKLTAKPARLQFVLTLLIGATFCSATAAQVVINEIVKEERTAGSGGVDPDVREFIELYNAGSAPVNLANWSVRVIDLASGAAGVTDTIPSGMLAPGDYFVIGGSATPNVDFSPVATDLYLDQTAHVIELVNSSGNVADAIGYEVFRSGLSLATTDQLAEIGRGFQGQLISMNAVAPNEIMSWSRYRDGVDTNRNGLDFGMLPVTPGESNNLPLNDAHTVPDVDGMSVNSTLSDDYFAAFVMPRVIDPTVATGVNPRAIPASPQGGNAIVAWDETGGGNAAFSKELVNRFDIFAYFDTTPLGVGADTGFEEWETSSYGIGSTDAFYGNPDPTGGIYVEGTVTQNGSTGIGWVYQQYENPEDAAADFSRLVLVDFGMGGNSTAEAGEWTVIETIDMSTVDADWYRLSVDYDPATGEVTAIFDDQTFSFTTSADLAGTFFVGYREAITSQGDRFDKLNPPIYDLYTESTGLAGDYNGDGLVDAADYTVWRDALGQSGEDLTADGDGSGEVDDADFAIWKANFGSSSAEASVGAAPVPEPSSILLSLLGVMAVMTRVRRRAA